MNSYNSNWGSNSWNSPAWTPQYPAAQLNTNKVYVISLEDALSRTAPRGSEMVYFHQDANEFYVVKTDVDGRKTWMGFTYNIPNQDVNIPATKADFKSILERLERLEKKCEVNSDGQPDGQDSV